jgi:hypothetical protein
MWQREIHVGPDLFGQLVVTINFGVIGTRGQRRVHLVADIVEAQAMVGWALRCLNCPTLDRAERPCGTAGPMIATSRTEEERCGSGQLPHCERLEDPRDNRRSLRDPAGICGGLHVIKKQRRMPVLWRHPHTSITLLYVSAS